MVLHKGGISSGLNYALASEDSACSMVSQGASLCEDVIVNDMRQIEGMAMTLTSPFAGGVHGHLPIMMVDIKNVA